MGDAFKSFLMRLPKIAIVCDWLTSPGGAERVVGVFHRMYPEAPIFTSIYHAKRLPEFSGANVKTSFLQHWPFAKTRHPLYFAQMPQAFESFDLSQFDVVISSSHSCAKGIITKPSTLHISYCHSPPRYLWDGSHEYLEEYPWPRWLKRTVIPGYLQKLRVWDRAAAERVDVFVANSHHVAKRIQKYYRREATVIYPPVGYGNEGEKNIERNELGQGTGSKNNFPKGNYLAVGRLVPYKRFDLVVKAFNLLGLPLKVVGEGNLYGALKDMAGPNIEFLGHVSEEELERHYREARALIFPQVEDFGITPLEAMAHGCPVIAYGAGGVLETVVQGKSGLFFYHQTLEALAKAVQTFDGMTFEPRVVRAQAQKFSTLRFEEEFKNFVNLQWQAWTKPA